MPSAIASLSKEEQVSAVMDTILQALVAEADQGFVQRYIGLKESTTDRADQMRIDIAFSDKVGELRKEGFITTPAKELRAKAQEIVESQPTEMWFGVATQFAASLSKK